MKRSKNKYALIIHYVIIVMVFAVFWGRAFQLQVVNADKYENWKKSEYWRTKKIKAKRGRIFDRNGILLAQDITKYNIVIEPSTLLEKDSATKAATWNFIRRHFKYDGLSKKSFFKQNKIITLAKNVDEDVANQVNEFRQKYKTYFFRAEKVYKRIYPYDSYAGQVLGFVNGVNRGVSGIEYYADKILRGRDGEEITIVTPRAVWENPDASRKKPIPGGDVYLTIDLDVQAIAESELKSAVKKSGSRGGMVVVMKPNTGEVLAIASAPTFNPNHPGRYTVESRKNRAITDIFEPGSTFKIVPAAALLESGKVNEDSIVYCENGKYRMYNTVIHDHKKYGWLTFSKVIANSSNIGMAKLTGEYLSSPEMYRAIKQFGFGEKTGIELPGEVRGLVRPLKKWSGRTAASLSFGHEIGVTAIQLANAFACVANGGMRVQPHVVRQMGDEVPQAEKTEVRVISENVSRRLSQMLMKVVNGGTGKNAHISGLKIAGKTGTAQKIKKDGSGYSQNKYVASFVGFFPADNAEFVILVMLDSPNTPQHTGGTAAAPVFKNLVQKIMALPAVYTKLNRKIEESDKFFIGDFTGQEIQPVLALLKDNKIKVRTKGNGHIILKQSLKNQFVARHKASIEFQLTDFNINKKQIPDLRGKTVREAVILLNHIQIPFSISGHGIVKKQIPRPGTVMKQNTTLKLVCG